MGLGITDSYALKHKERVLIAYQIYATKPYIIDLGLKHGFSNIVASPDEASRHSESADGAAPRAWSKSSPARLLRNSIVETR